MPGSALDPLSGRLLRFGSRWSCISLFGAAAHLELFLDSSLLLEGEGAAAARKAFEEIHPVWSVLPDTGLEIFHTSVTLHLDNCNDMGLPLKATQNLLLDQTLAG